MRILLKLKFYAILMLLFRMKLFMTEQYSIIYIYNTHKYIIHNMQIKNICVCLSFPGGSESKESSCNVGDQVSTSGPQGRSFGEGNGYPPQYSCLENSMDREAWHIFIYAHLCVCVYIKFIRLYEKLKLFGQPYILYIYIYIIYICEYIYM